jgi:hypothetical protein
MASTTESTARLRASPSWVVAHRLAPDLGHRRLGQQLGAVLAQAVEHPPAAHDRQLPAEAGAFFQHRHLAAAVHQELRQLQPDQPAADDRDALAQRHPQARQVLDGVAAVGDAGQAAGLHQGALGEGQLALGDLLGPVVGHQAAQLVAGPHVVLLGAGDGRGAAFGAGGHDHRIGLELADQPGVAAVLSISWIGSFFTWRTRWSSSAPFSA